MRRITSRGGCRSGRVKRCGAHARRPDDTKAVADWRARMSTDDAKAIYKQRAATAERVNAQARNSGLTRFIVRGVEKAKAVACWHELANARTCGWRSAPA